VSNSIRVALSGSGFRLPAHLGALQAIADAGWTVIEIAGTSGGSIVAALFASGMPLLAMHDLCMTYDWSPMMGFSPWTLLTKGALCSGNTLLDFLTKQTGGKTFADLAIDLRIIASDLVTETEFQFSKDHTPDAPIAVAARASASIPIVFTPVEYGMRCLVDGGCCDNVPASDLTVDQVPRLGIYLQANDPPLLAGRRGIADLAPRMIDLLLASNEASHIALDTHNGAVIVPVETAYASSFDRNMSLVTRTRLYNDGYTAARKALIAIA
jgi:NTE family protein